MWRQRDAEVVAEFIQGSGVLGGVVHYHGGMDSATRSTAYSKVSTNCDGEVGKLSDASDAAIPAVHEGEGSDLLRYSSFWPRN